MAEEAGRNYVENLQIRDRQNRELREKVEELETRLASHGLSSE